MAFHVDRYVHSRPGSIRPCACRRNRKRSPRTRKAASTPITLSPTIASVRDVDIRRFKVRKAKLATSAVRPMSDARMPPLDFVRSRDTRKTNEARAYTPSMRNAWPSTGLRRPRSKKARRSVSWNWRRSKPTASSRSTPKCVAAVFGLTNVPVKASM